MTNNQFMKINNISKTFPGVKALENVELEIRFGEVHALVGENGAGKSTLIKILSGVQPPDKGGEIVIEGEKVKHFNPRESVKKGISVIYQDFSLFPNLTVAENISISQQIENGSKVVDWMQIKNTAKNAIEKLGVDIDINKPLGLLSIAKQQLVAIACSIAQDAKMIIMDEPTSALSKGEVELLFKIIRSLKEKGIAILFISHKMDELFEIADRFTVLRDGEYIGTKLKSEVDEEKLIAMMVGRNIEYVKYEINEPGEVLFEAKDISKKGSFSNINFKLHAGEILGFTGLVGAGRTEVAEAIFGLRQPEKGTIEISGEVVDICSTKKAVDCGIGFVPESRKTQGLILEKEISDNIVLSILDNISNKIGLVNVKLKDSISKEWIEKLNIKPAYPDYITQKLSGGNQQKIVIAKWLATNPKILIVDEPTNGVDIGAKSEIHKMLKTLAKKGLGIIVISSELPEILAISDRIMVMKKGRIAAEFRNGEVSQEQIMNKAL